MNRLVAMEARIVLVLADALPVVRDRPHLALAKALGLRPHA